MYVICMSHIWRLKYMTVTWIIWQLVTLQSGKEQGEGFRDFSWGSFCSGIWNWSSGTWVPECQFRQWRSDYFRLEKIQDQKGQEWYLLEMTGPSTRRRRDYSEPIRTLSDIAAVTGFATRLWLSPQVGSSSAVLVKLNESEAPFLSWVFLPLRSLRQSRIFRDIFLMMDRLVQKYIILGLPDHGLFANPK